MSPTSFSSVLAAFLALVPVVQAAENAATFQPADTSSPRATLKSFIDACNDLYDHVKQKGHVDRTSPEYRRIGQRIRDCLDQSELPAYDRDASAGEAAVSIKEVLDRVPIPPYEKIPGVDEIEAAGGLKELSKWRLPGTRITIARAEEGPQRNEYLFTPGTVARATDYYQDMKSLPYRTTGPTVSPISIAGMFQHPESPD